MNLLLGLPLGIFRMLGVALMTLLRFLPVVIVLIFGIWIYRKHRKMVKNNGNPDPEPAEKAEKKGPKFTGPVVTVDYKEVKEEDPSLTPESPAPFGHKPGWLAVRSRDPRTVCDVLGLTDRKQSNWTQGLSAVGPGRWFVTPSLEGWVLVIGAGEREVSQERFGQLSHRFSEAQVYISDREKSAYLWSLYKGGQCIRAYGMSRGQVILDQGELTPEEIALGFGRFPRKSGGSREDFPDSDDVLSIAAAWGLDPMLEDKHFPPSLGWLCSAE